MARCSGKAGKEELMFVRRLDPVQPESFTFTPENLAWARATIAKYPEGKQASAVIPVLWRAQEQNDGWVSRPAMEYVARLLGMAFIRVYEVATFYTMFQLSPVGKKAHIQVCGTTPCMLRGAEDLKKVCQRKIHPEPHHLSADGDFSWEEVECLGACVNAPMVQIFKDTYEDLTPESFEKIIDDLAAGRPVKAGPQIDRQFSAPEGGPTTLTDKSLYNDKPIRRQEPLPPPPPPVMQSESAKAEAIKEIVRAPMPEAAMEPAKASANDRTKVVRPAKSGHPTAAEKAAAASLSPAETGPKAGTSKRRAAQDKVTRVHPDDSKPRLLKKPQDGRGDDLKLIRGVGPKLEKMLNGLGVWHFEQIGGWTKAELKWVDARLEGFKGRAERDEWVKQAKKLAKGWRPGSAIGEKPK
jgi:NADH-quinone oxidoreductase subunit E